MLNRGLFLFVLAALGLPGVAFSGSSSSSRTIADVIEMETDQNYINCLRDHGESNQASSIRALDCSGKQIETILHLDEFQSLTRLLLSNNNLAYINISKNTELEIFYAYNNEITKIDLLNNQALVDVSIYNNLLTNADFSNNTKLKQLRVWNNNLSYLNLSNNRMLKFVIASFNELKAAPAGLDGIEERNAKIDLTYNPFTESARDDLANYSENYPNLRYLLPDDIANGGFEFRLEAWKKRGGSDMLTLSDSVSCNGDHSLRVAPLAEGLAERVRLVSSYFRTEPGREYTVSMWINADAEGGAVRLSTANGVNDQSHELELIMTTGWEQVHWTFTANTKNTRLALDLEAKQASYYIDDIAVQIAPPPSDTTCTSPQGDR